MKGRIFLVLFALPFLAFRSRRQAEADDEDLSDAPWLRNRAWQTPRIHSSSKKAMVGAWLFAGFWNAVSAPLPLVLAEEVLENGNPVALVGFVFPLVGAFVALAML